jgi:monoamine oxidase
MYLPSLISFILFLVTSVASTRDVDVAIVGAGLSGLAAAKDIAKAVKTFVILEARDRVGGRVLGAHLAHGEVEELGAEFVGPTQDRVLALAALLDLTTYPTYTTGKSILYRNGTVHPYDADLATGGLPPVGPEAQAELASFITELDHLASELDVHAPWKHANAPAWDGMTLKSFAESRMTLQDSLLLFETAIRSILSTETAEPSLLYMLSYIAAAGNQTNAGTIARLIGSKGAAQDSRINGGTQLLATRLAERLGVENIFLNSPVREVKLKGDRYTVRSDTVQVSAKHVVIAMSPPMAGRISYDPLLPAGRDQLTQRMPMGSIGKAIAIYPKHWWRSLGFNGQVQSDTGGAIRATYDNTPASESFGAIMGFIEADEMRALDRVSQTEINRLVIEDLVRYFGPQAANVSQILIQRWDLEEFSRGGPVAYCPPGVLTKYGLFLRNPAARIHFAGTETAPYWTGYMDGAIRSGERVAAEILSDF